jgi:hypothetical protein
VIARYALRARSGTEYASHSIAALIETARGLLDLAERELKRAQRIVVRRVRRATGGAS